MVAAWVPQALQGRALPEHRGQVGARPEGRTGTSVQQGSSVAPGACRDRVSSCSGATRLTSDLRCRGSWRPCGACRWRECGRVGRPGSGHPAGHSLWSSSSYRLGPRGAVSQRPHPRLRDACGDVLAAAPQGLLCVSLGDLRGTCCLLGIKNQQTAETLNPPGKCDPSASRSWTGPVSRARPGQGRTWVQPREVGRRADPLGGARVTPEEAVGLLLRPRLPPCPQASAAAPGSPPVC